MSNAVASTKKGPCLIHSAKLGIANNDVDDDAVPLQLDQSGTSVLSACIVTGRRVLH